MPYGSAKKGAVIAAVGALALATLISLGAVYGLGRPVDPDALTTESAALDHIRRGETKDLSLSSKLAPLTDH
jgi:hypothetical protein